MSFKNSDSHAFPARPIRCRRAASAKRVAVIFSMFCHGRLGFPCQRTCLASDAGVRRWFAEEGLDWLRTYPSTMIGEEPDDLFAPAADAWPLEAWAAQLGWMRTPGRRRRPVRHRRAAARLKRRARAARRAPTDKRKTWPSQDPCPSTGRTRSRSTRSSPTRSGWSATRPRPMRRRSCSRASPAPISTSASTARSWTSSARSACSARRSRPNMAAPGSIMSATG